MLMQVRVIARSTLKKFVLERVENSLRASVDQHLDDWYRMTLAAEWRNSAELKLDLRSASIVSSERVVFNIKGNEFRLVVAVNYGHAAVFVLWLGTHREYDRIDVKQVEFDKGRYADPTDSN